MIKKTTLLFFAMFSLTWNTKAQQNIFFGINTFQHSTWFMNINDLKPHTVEYGQFDLKTKFKFSSSYGLEFGYQFNKHYSVILQPQFTSIKQQYEGNYVVKVGQGGFPSYSLTSSTKLNYFKLPLLIQHTTNTDKKFRILSELGLYYALLLNYRDSLYYDEMGTQADRYFTMKNKDYSMQYQGAPSVFTGYADKELYKSNNIGVVLGFGGAYAINKNLLAYLMLKADYSITDMEEHDKITIKQTNASNPQTTSYRVDYTVKYFYNSGKDRDTPTRMLNAGLQLGLRFML